LAPNEDYIVKHLQIIETRLAKLKLQGPSREKELAFADFDPTEFGQNKATTTTTTKTAATLKQSSSTIKVKVPNFLPSSTSNSQQQQQQPKSSTETSKDPIFLEPNESYPKHARIIQNNYAADFDDASSGM